MTDQLQHKQPFWEVYGLPAPGTPITAEEYAQLPETTIHIEIREGVVVYPHLNEDTMTPAPIPNHQDVSGNIYDVLKAHQRKSDGKTYYAPIDVYLPDHDTPVQPDLIWIAPENVGVIKDTNVQGTPDLVVEILSPGTAQYDRTHKFDQYQVAGVREYWIVDPRDRLIEVYRLDEGRFNRVGAYTDAFKSPLLDVNVQVKRLFDG